MLVVSPETAVASQEGEGRTLTKNGETTGLGTANEASGSRKRDHQFCKRRAITPGSSKFKAANDNVASGQLKSHLKGGFKRLAFTCLTEVAIEKCW
jgi:hypothetical protein